MPLGAILLEDRPNRRMRLALMDKRSDIILDRERNRDIGDRALQDRTALFGVERVQSVRRVQRRRDIEQIRVGAVSIRAADPVRIALEDDVADSQSRALDGVLVGACAVEYRGVHGVDCKIDDPVQDAWEACAQETGEAVGVEVVGRGEHEAFVRGVRGHDVEFVVELSACQKLPW